MPSISDNFPNPSLKQGPSQRAQSARTSRISARVHIFRKCKCLLLYLRSWHLSNPIIFTLQELREIFSHAPQLPSFQDSDSSGQSNNRKEISGDCPICFTEFEPGREEIVWCKAACGNNIHKTCFQQWAKSQNPGTEVRCVFWQAFSLVQSKGIKLTNYVSRTPWQGETVSTQQIKETGQVNREGYVNVASQLGISGERGKSTPFFPPTQRHSAELITLFRLFNIPRTLGPRPKIVRPMEMIIVYKRKWPSKLKRIAQRKFPCTVIDFPCVRAVRQMSLAL